MAKLALKKHAGDIMKAAEELLATGGFIDGDIDDEFNGESSRLNIHFALFFVVFQKMKNKKNLRK